MGSRVLTLALATALVTRDVAKLLLGITDSSSDAKLDLLIASASDDIGTHVGRVLVRQKYQDSDPQPLPGDGTRLLLSQFPIDRDQVTVTIAGAAVTDFEVEEAAIGRLYRAGGWPTSDVDISFFAGYVSPDRVKPWVNLTVYVKGDFVRPSSSYGFTAPLLFEVTAVTGAAGASEPTWPTTGGVPVTSALAVFTARDAEEVPPALRNIAFLEVKNRNELLTRVEGLRSMQVENYSESYSDTVAASELSPSVVRSLELWKYGR